MQNSLNSNYEILTKDQFVELPGGLLRQPFLKSQNTYNLCTGSDLNIFTMYLTTVYSFGWHSIQDLISMTFMNGRALLVGVVGVRSLLHTGGK